MGTRVFVPSDRRLLKSVIHSRSLAGFVGLAIRRRKPRTALANIRSGVSGQLLVASCWWQRAGFVRARNRALGLFSVRRLTQIDADLAVVSGQLVVVGSQAGAMGSCPRGTRISGRTPGVIAGDGGTVFTDSARMSAVFMTAFSCKPPRIHLSGYGPDYRSFSEWKP